MADDGLKVKISGDSSHLQSELKTASGSVDEFAEDVKDAAKYAAGFGAAITAALTAAVVAAGKETANITKLKTAMDNVGLSYDKAEDKLESWIDTMQQATGFASNEQRDALSNLVILTGDLSEAQELLSTAMDLSIWKSIDLKTASDLLGKVYTGDTSTLKRYGIILDENATATKALAQIQRLAAGQAEAYGDTLAGEYETLKNNLGDLGQAVGAVLEDDVRDAIRQINNIIQNIKEWISENPELTKTLVKVAAAITGVVTTGATLHIIIPKLTKLITGLKTAFTGLAAAQMTSSKATMALALAALYVYSVYRAYEEAWADAHNAEIQYKAIIEAVTASIKEHSKALEDTKANLAAASKELTEQTKSLTEAEKTLQSYKDEYSDAIADWTSAFFIQNDLKNLYNDMAPAIHKAQAEVKDWTDAVSDAQAEVDSLSVDLAEANGALQKAQKEFDLTTDKVNDLEDALSDVNNELRGLSNIQLEGMGEFDDEIQYIQEKLNDLEVKRLEIEIAGGDTSAIDAQIDALEKQQRLLKAQKTAAYDQDIYDISKSIKEALAELSGVDTEMSAKDIYARINELVTKGIDIQDALNQAITEQDAAARAVSDAQAEVDSITVSLEMANKALVDANTNLAAAEKNLADLESAAKEFYNNLMGISDEQSEILKMISQEIITQQEIYDTLNDKTLPALWENVTEQSETVDGLKANVEVQTNIVQGLQAAVVSINDQLEYAQLLYNAITGTNTYPNASMPDLTKHAHGGLLTEPTLLTNAATGETWGIAAESGDEWIVPEGRTGTFGNLTVNQSFTVNAPSGERVDVKMLARELYRLQQDGLRRVGING